MSSSRSELMARQWELTWSLFEYHAERLEAADFLWEPAPLCWTMRRQAAGGWAPDWADTEPDPVPVPTVAWLTWHIGWWLSVSADHVAGRTPRERAEIVWPGPGDPAVAWLRGLREEWSGAVAGLTEADLDRTAPFPWAHDPEHTLASMLAWVNAELMKNVAEIGQLRLLRAASAR
ncbi:damage-inducible protein DinB [Streptomyces cyaneogriseus subsp. noncyanogenus]|uniref:Damage-inducible protein DinB n=1 Tax=Streptomyces cyaneogriseus subsp. noncyanogenus TaxID=477245 RepID=A0A0C5GMY6_9ACTN|nr:DinB family protein [Streptomyces cyaneogriseus]AJP05926.1 damage-inducible protein DinB [Streptomyces cyaneogriseus subsp. noncyanogenus]